MIFCDFSVRMEPGNKKTESIKENENKENKISLLDITGFLFSAPKINKYEDHFFSVLYAI